MQNYPDQVTKPMSDRPDGLIVSKARDKTAIDNFKNAAFRLDRCVGALIENTPHVAIALRGAVALGFSRTLFISRTCSDPRGEVFG